MLLDLAEFARADDYRRTVSRRSGGNIAREVKRAATLGIHVAAIRPESYQSSIASIAASKRFRSGGPMAAAWLPAIAPPDTSIPPVPPPCPQHYTLAWGAFAPGEGGPRLIAHLSLRRVGDMCRIFEMMAHGDHLHTGAMKLLFMDVVAWLIDRRDDEAQGVRWLMYGAMEHGSLGLHQWKRRMGFEPANLLFDAPFDGNCPPAPFPAKPAPCPLTPSSSSPPAARSTSSISTR